MWTSRRDRGNGGTTNGGLRFSRERHSQGVWRANRFGCNVSKQMSDKPTGPLETGHVDPESTFSLIERARAGDVEALERLFAKHLKPLQRWATGRLPKWARDLADTDDLVQDTLLRTFKKIESFEPRRVGALQAYLRNAVLNRLRDELRRKGREPESTNLDDVVVEAATDSPLEAAIGREKVKAYENALQRLPPEQREAIIARVELGYSYEEMAVMLDKPSAEAARKTAQRALVRLAEEMKRGRERTSS
jgi:RNA polymerase sigma-70 factor (ECF subfamily)